MEALQEFWTILVSHSSADMLLGIFMLLFLVWLSDLLARRVLLRIVRSAVQHTHWHWDDIIFEGGAFKRLARVIPTLVLQFGIALVPDVTPKVELVIANLALGATLLYVVLAATAALTALQNMPISQFDTHAPIKGYLQLLKILLYVVGSIVIVAVIINRSPTLMLSGLGALSAVLGLIFKDTLLGFVASVQISSNDMLRIGDWIEMPSAGADGEVIDISLHTVKVRNWDSTIITIPTWRLISESFKNWRGMFDSGGRRIKRALYINASSVHFLSEAEDEALHRFRLLDAYLQKKGDEVLAWNARLGDAGEVLVNQRRLTNLGTFRAYVQAYLDANPLIHHDRTCMVRQLATEGDGIPLELYCFTTDTAWVAYEGIQSDIFDHLFAILPEFGLGLYQRPGGADFRNVSLQALPADLR